MKANNAVVSRIMRGSIAFGVGLWMTASAFAQPSGGLPTVAHPKVKEVIAVQDAVTDDLMATDGVLGTAVGAEDDGKLVLVIYVNGEHKNIADVMSNLPRTLRGIPVRIEVTEPFRSMVKAVPARGKPSVGKVSHTAKQEHPIQLGTSGGWGYDLANGYCCGGTLGALVQKDGTQYVLSNYHVLEADTVTGGNGIIATAGDPVVQPGLIDASCNITNTQSVSGLSGIKSLPNSNVDAAIAQVVQGMVDPSGAILEIGTLSKSTVSAEISQSVKKSGRTTGLTNSIVSGLNAKVSVSYDNECAGGADFTKIFTGQIMIKNKGSSFLNSGDSGSLMVENVASNPRAVGLLFAGSSTLAVANPIADVLGFLGASMVGQ